MTSPRAVGRRARALVVALVAVACLSILTNVFLYQAYETRTRELTGALEILQRENAELRSGIEVLRQQLKVGQPELVATPTNGRWVYIAAVYLEEETLAVKGEVLRAYARFVPGSGKVLVTTSPRIGIDLQASAETAFAVAQRLTYPVTNLDVVITVVSNRTITVVDGPSAGASLTSLLYSALSGRELRKDVVVTGTIQPDGSVGKVGGILEKALAVAQLREGMTLVVPEGQSTVRTLVETTRERWIGIWRIRDVRYEPVTVGVEEYVREQGHKITVVEASTASGLMELVLAGGKPS